MDSIHALYVEWCRLKGYEPPKNGLEVMIDEATGADDSKMEEFCQWLMTDIFSRTAK